MGSLDNPFNPISLALGAEATFVARTIDSDRKHLTGVLKAAADHRGTSFVEIYQNCPIFNDDAFAAVKDPETSADAIIPLTHGQPIRFGTDGHLGVVRDAQTGAFRVVEVAPPGEAPAPGSQQVGEAALAVHDAHLADPSFAFGLSRLTDAGVLHRAPIGIFRDVEAPAYDDLVREQIELAGGHDVTEGDLQALINGGDTWLVR
jgi:2-oxoglutarate/2-oxoacid ferredoxin oxidoreductase subunit beta